MISNKLLSEVSGFNVVGWNIPVDKLMYIKFDNDSEYIINIHELVYKCKMWAWLRDCNIDEDMNCCYVLNLDEELLYSCSKSKEPFDAERVFDCVQWVLENTCQHEWSKCDSYCIKCGAGKAK